MKRGRIATIAAMAIVAAAPATAGAANRGHHHGGGHHRGGNGLWKLYDQTLSKARYIDLTHHITPNMPVWKRVRAGDVQAGRQPGRRAAYTYADDGFEATAYQIATDQFGTQLDPPAHWAPEYPGIDELPPTYAVRPLVVISIVQQVQKDPKYALRSPTSSGSSSGTAGSPKGSV